MEPPSETNTLPASTPLVCHACARDNAAANRFCIHCGHALEPPAPPAAEALVPTLPCAQCAAANAPDNRYCTACGFPLETFRTDPSQFKKVCTGCGAVNEPAYAYCYRCGLPLPQQFLPQAQVGGSPAGFWIRLLAFLIDGVLLGISNVVITAFFAGFDPERTMSELYGESTGWAATLVSLGVGIAYYTFPMGLWGRTLGKAILGLKVTRMDGSKLSYLRAFARYWAYYLSAIPLFLGFLSIALSAQKRGWHDFLCDTRVVSTRKRG